MPAPLGVAAPREPHPCAATGSQGRMPWWGPDLVLSLHPRLLLLPGSEGYVAYQADTGCLYRLNACAALILELFRPARSTRQVCADLKAVLGTSRSAQARRWMDSAIANGLLDDSSSPVRARPLEAAAVVRLAQNLRDRGRILAACVCQQHAAGLLADDPEVWRELAELAHILGRREDARRAYERVLSLCPGDAEIEHILSSLRDAPSPPRASDACIRRLYSRFAAYYEENMRAELDYQGPELLAAAVLETTGTRYALDVLDLGCGTGLMGRHLRPLARGLTGVDLSAEMLQRARRTGCYDRLHIDEITRWLGRETGPSFDLMAACDTLIYFGDLAQVVLPAASRLRPGGRLAFSLEKGSHAGPFRLTDSGRYTHTERHIRAVAARARLSVDLVRTETLRYEYGEPVEGLLVVLTCA